MDDYNNINNVVNKIICTIQITVNMWTNIMYVIPTL
ncbi:hypothetical protein SD1D_1322 [Herbinix luporum]|uniref:Uncharacterized protein n=1 Tax=Herbinix luporum TaxID=1679721 RepID=A0A0K8J6B0_9FIRM|nr:hypothetical protein SD1D_1322 [Herbinix luporum]